MLKHRAATVFQRCGRWQSHQPKIRFLAGEPDRAGEGDDRIDLAWGPNDAVHSPIARNAVRCLRERRQRQFQGRRHALRRQCRRLPQGDHHRDRGHICRMSGFGVLRRGAHTGILRQRIRTGLRGGFPGVPHLRCGWCGRHRDPRDGARLSDLDDAWPHRRIGRSRVPRGGRAAQSLDAGLHLRSAIAVQPRACRASHHAALQGRARVDGAIGHYEAKLRMHRPGRVQACHRVLRRQRSARSHRRALWRNSIGRRDGRRGPRLHGQIRWHRSRHYRAEPD